MTAAARRQDPRVERLRRNKQELDEVRLLQASVELRRRRAARPDIWTGDPLISVRIATVARPQLLVERAVASVLEQTYPHFEVVIVGDHAGPETAAALAQVKDPRVKYLNLPARPDYAKFPRFFWATAGTDAVNAALDRCQGEWVAPLDDDDEFSPDHLEVLLRAAQTRQLEMVYGQMEVEVDGQWRPLGKAPLTRGQVVHAGVLYSARLLGLRYDKLAWLCDDPGDWNLWKRMDALGARIGFVEQVLGRHYPERSGLPPEERAAQFSRVPTPEEILEDTVRSGGAALLEMA